MKKTNIPGLTPRRKSAFQMSKGVIYEIYDFLYTFRVDLLRPKYIIAISSIYIIYIFMNKLFLYKTKYLII